MATLTIIEYFDIVENASLGGTTGCKVLMVQPFVLQGAEKAFGRGIVVAVAGTAHTDTNAPAL